ncbi:hypothetical protein [Butyricimonas sp.]|uniref:hypothetical protein n=1 Tax=Butyricimonas sp. TaxID=1969738 RepID=UPI0025C6A149|nr:hypothetical protein [Butyricimonas sp.]
MKKIWIMMLMICSICVFTACSDDDDDPTPQNPVSNVKIPATAEIGTEIIVSGTGFASTAQFSFKGTESSADVTKITVVSTGVTMTIPMNLTPGQHTLILKQNGEWDLGVIELTAASLPIIGLEIPAEGFTGQTINIGGNGYNETSKVYLETENGTRTELTVTDYQSGLTCTLPASLTTGTYALVLTQDGGEWELTEEFEVVQTKRLVKIGWVNDFSQIMPDYITESTYEISYANNEPQSFKYANVTYDSEINYGVQINNNQIILSVGETEESWEEVFEGYVKQVTLKTNNNFAQSNATIFYDFYSTKEINMSGKWAYADQYMKSYEGKGGFNNWEYTFDATNNLIDVSGTTFEYDTKKYTRPGVDIAALLCTLQNLDYTNDWGWMYAAFTGLLGEKSTGLPVKMSTLDPETEETTTCELTYSSDDDNYITSVSYKFSYYGMGTVTCRIDFTYENM